MATPQKQALLARREALRRFDRWVAAHPMDLTPANALAEAGRLYDACATTS